MFESPEGASGHRAAKLSGGWLGLQIHFGMHHRGLTEDLWDTSSLDPGESWLGTDAQVTNIHDTSFRLHNDQAR